MGQHLLSMHRRSRFPYHKVGEKNPIIIKNAKMQLSGSFSQFILIQGIWKQAAQVCHIAITFHLTGAIHRQLPSTLGRTGLCGWEHSITLGWSFWHHDSPSRLSVYISVAPSAIFFLCYSLPNVLRQLRDSSEWAMEKLKPGSTWFNPSTSLGKENYKSFHRNTHTLDIMFYYYDNEDSYPGLEGEGYLFYCFVIHLKEKKLEYIAQW